MAFLAVFASFSPAGAQMPAAGINYTVEGVEVDVTAKNAVEARGQAMEEAQVKAFEQLVEQALSEEERAAYTMPDPATIMSLVQDFEVTNEQLSAVRYKGQFTVRFRPSVTARYLSTAPMMNQPQIAGTGNPLIPTTTNNFNQQSDQTIMVLPFYQDGRGGSYLWTMQNPWRPAWQQAAYQQGGPSFIMPQGDPTDINSMREDQPLTYDPAALQRLSSRYRADMTAIVLASPEYQGTQMSALNVAVYRAGSAGPEFIKNFSVPAHARMSQAVLFGQAAAQVQNILASLPVSAQISPQPVMAQPRPQAPAQMPVIAAPMSGKMVVRANFSSMQEWIKLKSVLASQNNLRLQRVIALTPRNAVVEIGHNADLIGVRQQLSGAGLSVSPVQTVSMQPESPVLDISFGQASYY